MDAATPGNRGGMEHPGRIVVVSADVGVGHDTAAAELARRLRDRGFVVDRHNLLDLLPRPVHWAFREAYRGILRWLPWSYDALFGLASRSQLSVSVLRTLLRPVRRRMRRAIPPDTRAVVTTYPFANQLLGPLRRQGRLTVPVITYVTDVVVHPTWLCPGVDVYCAIRPAEVPPAGAADGVDVTFVQPLVSRAFADEAPAAAAGRAERGDAGRRPDRAESGDPARLIAEAASHAGSAGIDERCRRALGDSVGDAVAVVAALLQASAGGR
ncbi:hypothetical protein ACGFI9_11080 [Micromonospora sp. NPDC048930]|uniref:MGDG synthase family glycosyltransferase n=1 Tax=Micromonospora sp. NPDC048930 TaxID=3364261 RepID=UPI00371CECC5